ncbi:MAG: YvcK family protein [Herpetosiphon sp.]|nr:YvcK family protein [Herpetosiphon sp.]
MQKRPTFDRRWFAIGIGVKRWLALLLFGLSLSALGLAFGLRELYTTTTFPPIVYYLTLQFWPRTVRMIILCVLGIGASTIAFTRLNRVLLSAMLPRNSARPDLAKTLLGRSITRRGPRVVALGGGHGLSTLLSGLKQFTDNITAIVAVADDGGSSGRIREEFGILPPGDIRRCLAALAEAEPLMTRLFEHRFSSGSLEGHTFGNLFITALAEVTGSFENAVREANRVLAVRGQIVPATLDDVVLWAELANGDHISGESRIAKSGQPIKRVYLRPDALASRGTIKAIHEADLIVLGPGSLYTSLLATMMIPEIAQAIRDATQAVRVYVCNVATEPGETDHFGVQAHIQALIDHVGTDVFDLALANSDDRQTYQFAPEWQGRTNVVPLDLPKASPLPIRTANVINPTNPLRHDPVKLARELMKLVDENQKSEIRNQN